MSEQQGNQGNVANLEGQGQQQVQPQTVTDVLSPEAKRILKKEREEAREAERKRVQEEYGVPPEEARRIIAEAKEREESRQTEVQKATRKLETEQTAHQKTKQELEDAYAHIAQMAQENALRGALTEAGVKPARIKAALRLADMDLLEVDGDGNVSGMEDAVSAIRDESPEWFADSEPPQRRAPDASRSRTQDGSAMGASDLDTAKRRFNEGLFSRIRT